MTIIVRSDTSIKLFILSSQLFGSQNPGSHLWVDGLVSKWLRDSTLTCDTMAELLTSKSSEKQRFARMMGSLSHVKKWLVLDGPMDDTWLENMGTLLDSTKALSLTNGESIAQPGEIVTRTAGCVGTESMITVGVFFFFSHSSLFILSHNCKLAVIDLWTLCYN